MCEQCLHEEVCKYKQGFNKVQSVIKNTHDSAFSLTCILYKHNEEIAKEA